MNRTLDATAALLGLKPRAFRSRLRELGILTQNGELASKHRDQGYLYVDTRSRWNANINRHEAAPGDQLGEREANPALGTPGGQALQVDRARHQAGWRHCRARK